MIRLYNAATGAAAPFLRVYLRRRAARGKEIPSRLPEREGIASRPRPEGRLIWFHAASVGETISILPVIAAIAPRANILLTTGTITAAQIAADRLPGNAIHQFFPLDVPAWRQKFLRHWQPDAAVFVESEIWPGMLTACDAAGIPRLLINARMSAKSARSWRVMKPFTAKIFTPFQAIHAQSAGDAANLRALCRNEILEWGNLKFFAPALPFSEAALVQLQTGLAGAKIFLAASTHPGEEEIILAADKILKESLPNLITIIVPRHPPRGPEISRLANNAPRRSLGQPPIPGTPYIADTLGELGLFFRAAPFAFIGNSLAGFGGHNIIEPALLARPVITGPHNENFAEAAALLTEAGALIAVTDCATLAQAASIWLNQPGQAAQAGQAARESFAQIGALPARLQNLILSRAR